MLNGAELVCIIQKSEDKLVDTDIAFNLKEDI